jgi:hypothetical protein
MSTHIHTHLIAKVVIKLNSPRGRSRCFPHEVADVSFDGNWSWPKRKSVQRSEPLSEGNRVRPVGQQADALWLADPAHAIQIEMVCRVRKSAVSFYDELF